MSELDEKQYTSGRCFLKLNDNNATPVTTVQPTFQNSMRKKNFFNKYNFLLNYPN